MSNHIDTYYGTDNVIYRQFKCAKPLAITLSSDGQIRIDRYVIGSWNKITEGELKG